MCKCTDTLNVKIKLLYEDAKLPEKAHESDACYDVVATSMEFNYEHYFLEYGLGFSTEIPEGYQGIIVPRSSITKTEWVMQNSPAQIDSAFRGEWKVRFKNIVKPEETVYHSDYNPDGFCFPFDIGDRIAQIKFEKVLPVTFITSDTLEDSDRGSGGFGSSGK